MSITLTEQAADRARAFLAKQTHAQGLRLGVRNSGCSGYMYVVQLADQIDPDDQVFDSQGVKVVVSAKNLPILDGMEVDYGKEGLNEGFRFRNPNATDSCGCGESFKV
ncbi:MAG: iron-sulfur cluster assembly accessory protein [Candidatus Competibacteraceae bacterium]|nr:MAG: iron-sulfur cluster assembly accessory protein [Candidatus Competibacteraceae bacterium]